MSKGRKENLIIVPTLVLDEVKCRNNINRMVEKAVANKVIFRPHFKTHQSAEIGEWFREAGVKKITASSLRMAKYFADAGWKDILVAFPVNILEIDLINQLADKIRLSLLVESVETVEFLSENLNSDIDAYIKTDSGLLRTGVKWDDYNSFSEILKTISGSGRINFKGFLTHAGNSYKARNREEINRIHIESTSRMVSLKNHFMNDFPGLIISVGDTPTCSTIDNFSMVDEIRPGNFVFYEFVPAAHVGVWLNKSLRTFHSMLLKYLPEIQRLEVSGRVNNGAPLDTQGFVVGY